VATYQRTEAYDYNRVMNAAPKRAPQRQARPAPRPRVIEKSRAQLRAEAMRSRKATIKALVICAIFFMFISFQIYSQVKVDELDRELNAVNTEISILDSENTRLNMQLDAMISLEKVDQYAQEQLGMVKVENYQVTYVDLSGDDSVVVSGGKTYRNLWQTLKAQFSK